MFSLYCTRNVFHGNFQLIYKNNKIDEENLNAILPIYIIVEKYKCLYDNA